MSTSAENPQDVIDVTFQAAAPNKLEGRTVYAIPVPKGGDVKIVDLNPEELRGTPDRKKGTVKAQSADSFVAYIKKHGHPHSEVYADRVNQSIVGVINAGAATLPADTDEAPAGWGDHRVEFNVIHTVSWKAWLANDGKFLKQVDFAEFIEDHLADIETPAAAEMLEVAQSISGSVNVNFESSKRLSTGEAQLEYRENVTASAGSGATGPKGSLEIPTLIRLGLVPFEGSAPYAVDARFRYRINSGDLLLSYKLVDPVEKVQHAFDELVSDIKEQLGEDTLVLDGVAAAPRTPAPSFSNLPAPRTLNVQA